MSGGFTWFATKHEAEATAAESRRDYTWSFGEVAKEFEIRRLTKPAILKLLNQVAGHPDNG